MFFDEILQERSNAMWMKKMRCVSNITVVIFIMIMGNIHCETDAESGDSGSGLESGREVEPSSGMLGDEIMPLSNMDNFGNHDIENENIENEDETVQKRGQITRVLKGQPGKTGTKRIWQYIYPHYHWVNAQQQQQQQQQQKPLQHAVPPGQCLDENSVCDVGHDEQCCGFATYCIDYWGVGKCLAFKQPVSYDKTIPARIHRNNLYKAQMRRMLYMAAAGQ
eukprot:Seg768.9 transcript_id=Seg768.9/GoldUCD/mRNA.D3Y31 product="hypothetical protein" protein_id=Seg768.9/GoldUCD/D3Y31